MKTNFKPIIISIEGNIGSGKSTLIEMLKKIPFADYNIKNLNVRDIIFIPEPVDEWNSIKDKNGETILSKFYNDTKKYSFAFQMMAYITRLAKTHEIIKKNPNCIFISERTLFTDKFVFCQMLYDSGFIEEVEYKIYNKWFDEFNTIAIKNYIYVKSNPDVCLDRVIKRNRNGEQSITKEYLTDCHKYHSKWLNDQSNVLVFDGNIDIGSNEYNKNIIENIKKHLVSLSKDL